MIRVITAVGGRPVLVGGYVRDAFLGVDSKDVDIEVYGLRDTERLVHALAEAGFHVGIAGKAFSVVNVRVSAASPVSFDISLPRLDSKTGPGHRGFEVIADGELSYYEASRRRDFTINALMYDPLTGEIIDCHGGVMDLADGVLRHTSDAFSDDPLRVLRGVQFSARFGFRMAPDTAALCRRLVGSYKELAKERVWGELEKLGTKGRHLSMALGVLADTGWEAHFPQLAALHGIEQDPSWHPEGDVHVHSGLAGDQAARLADEAGLKGPDRFVVVMASLLHDMGKVTHTQRQDDGRITSYGHADAGEEPARRFLNSIGCPVSLKYRILPLVTEHMSCIGNPTSLAVRRLARRLDPVSLAELAIVIGADQKGRGNPDAPNSAQPWLDKAATLNVQERPAPGLLTGRHLIDAGMTPGPAFKPLLAAAVAAQDAGEFSDEAGALAWLQAHQEGAK